jgi:hypothetical protein
VNTPACASGADASREFNKANIVSTTPSQVLDHNFAFAAWYLAPFVAELIVLAALVMEALR